MHWQVPPGMAGSCHYWEGLLSQSKGTRQGWWLVPRMKALSPQLSWLMPLNVDGLCLRKDEVTQSTGLVPALKCINKSRALESEHPYQVISLSL